MFFKLPEIGLDPRDSRVPVLLLELSDNNLPGLGNSGIGLEVSLGRDLKGLFFNQGLLFIGSGGTGARNVLSPGRCLLTLILLYCARSDYGRLRKAPEVDPTGKIRKSGKDSRF